MDLIVIKSIESSFSVYHIPLSTLFSKISFVKKKTIKKEKEKEKTRSSQIHIQKRNSQILPRNVCIDQTSQKFLQERPYSYIEISNKKIS